MTDRHRSDDEDLMMVWVWLRFSLYTARKCKRIHWLQRLALDERFPDGFSSQLTG